MSKAIEGAAMLAGAVALGGLAFVDPAIVASPLFMHLMETLVVGGISLEAAALAQAIGSQKGIGVTTRAAAGARQIIYGQQRIGGTTVYESSTGSPGNVGNYVYNFVIAVATHEIDAYINLYLDGRQVFWRSDGNAANVGCGSVDTPPTATVAFGGGGTITGITASGGSGFANVKPARYRVRIQGDGAGAAAYATNSGSVGSPLWTVVVTHAGSGYTWATAEIQGRYTFGGFARSDNPDPSGPGYGLGYGIGPGGPHYNFDGKVFAEVRFGDQVPGDFMASLYAYDPTWQASSRGAGVAYIFLAIGYEPSQFPQLPEVRITINGKNDIYDPRTGQKGFSTNWALQVADVLSDPVFGVGDQVNQAQLIAAANVCDELVTTSQGSESRYAQHIHYDTGTSPGDALSMMMPSAAGRLSYIAGEWFIWPAYWQGPSFTWDKSVLVETPQWSPKRSFRELFNRVNGTYIAPNYPYNVAGNLYDKNGWYYGTISNEWPFAWQPTNFPQYAADALHGYGSDVYLAEDGGLQLPFELSFRGVISIAQTQRVAKIYLMRNRQQGSGMLPMHLYGYSMQEIDVMEFSFPELGWVDKYLEVTKGEFFLREVKGDGDQGSSAQALGWNATVCETDPSVYAWSSAEELTPYDVPALPGSVATAPAPPTGLTLTDNTTTAVLQADGTSMPRLLVQWVPPVDNFVNINGKIQVQWQDFTGVFQGGAWIDVGGFAGDSTFCYIDNVSSVAKVNVRVRAMRWNGQVSDWANVNNHTLVRPSPLSLGAFTGDAGSGGGSGIVPAPPAGSAAAGWILGAGGAWVAPPSGSSALLTPVLKTANYSAVSGDQGKLLAFNSSSAITLTLPATAPTAGWSIDVQNIGSGALAISPNGLNIDGASGSLSLAQTQGLRIASDGTGYYTMRGAASGGGASFLQLTDPTSASLSWVNQGSGGTAASETIGTKSRFLYCPPRNAVSIVGRQLAAGTPPFSLAVGVIPLVLSGNFLAAGMYVSDGTKFVNIQIQSSLGGLGVLKYASSSSFSAAYIQPGNCAWSPVFMKIVDDGTKLYFYVGGTGQDWLLLTSTARLDYLSAISYMGFFVNAQNASYGVGINVISLVTGTS